MAYTVDEIAEMIRYHLVLAEDDNDRAAANLMDLVASIHDIADDHGLWSPGQTIFCDGCGASIDVELVAPGGHGWTRDGGAWCSDCRPASAQNRRLASGE